MKRNFNVPVVGSDGVTHARVVFAYEPNGMPVMELDKASGRKVQAIDHYEPMTLKVYALDALAGRWRGEEDLGNDVLFQRGKLHDKICFGEKDGEVELVAADVALILDALNHQGQSALVITRMKAMLETDPTAGA